MSYYQQPMGDYKTYGYAGDPGFLSSLWKGFKKVAKFIPGPIGTIARVAGVAGVALGGAKILTPPTFPGVGTVVGPPIPTTGYGPRSPGYGARGPSMLGSGYTFPSTRGMPEYAPGGPAVCPPTGYHLAKDGSGRFVRNRRMNVANPRALRRSMRRVQGFEKLARRTIQFTRRVKMKKRSS